MQTLDQLKARFAGEPLPSAANIAALAAKLRADRSLELTDAQLAAFMQVQTPETLEQLRTDPDLCQQSMN